MIILACGYSGTGSSAVIHLLSEYSNCTVGKLGKYEHTLFYVPNGLFDLEDRLLLNNSIHGADAAINEFRKAMLRLNNNDFGWFGSLKKMYGNKFMKIVDEFIDEITEFIIPGFWSYDLELKRSMLAVFKQILLKLSGRRVLHFGYKTKITGDGYIKFSFISRENYYAAAKKFVANYIDMITEGAVECFLFDQIFQPHHLNRLNRYFEQGEAKAIVVDRDPRDMFVLEKYVWPYMGMAPIVPPDAFEFAQFYKALICSAGVFPTDTILSLHFEDLIYNYDETVSNLETFLGSIIGSHEKYKHCFIPEKSIHNTQNFRMKSDWMKEVRVIEEFMPEYIYKFPYEFTPQLDNVTDP